MKPVCTFRYDDGTYCDRQPYDGHEHNQLGLRELQPMMHAHAKKQGFWDPETEPFPEKKLLLIISEVVEVMEDLRAGKPSSYLDEKGKPCGEGPECADVFIRLLDYCEARGIDLYAETMRKHQYNLTRPFRHGRKF